MFDITRRSSIGLGVASLIGLTVSASGSHRIEPVKAKVFEHTFLKANEGLRDHLRQYVVENWFRMDQKGLEQGIFTSYQLLEETEENAMWDYVMVVGYPTDLGYSDPVATERFTEIRKAHVEVKIDGRGLAELGKIVGNHRLKVVV